MMPGYEEPFKCWFDFLLFSEMGSSEALKERQTEREKGAIHWMANRIQMDSFILGPWWTVSHVLKVQ